jgi:hypothetical protein
MFTISCLIIFNIILYIIAGFCSKLKGSKYYFDVLDIKHHGLLFVIDTVGSAIICAVCYFGFIIIPLVLASGVAFYVGKQIGGIATQYKIERRL